MKQKKIYVKAPDQPMELAKSDNLFDIIDHRKRVGLRELAAVIKDDPNPFDKVKESYQYLARVTAPQISEDDLDALVKAGYQVEYLKSRVYGNYVRISW